MKRILVLVFILCTGAFGQTRPAAPEENPRSAELGLIARVDRDSVVLRWAPTKPGAWVIANRLGYVVERVRVNRDGSFNRKAYERLTQTPLRPWTRDEWLQRSQRDNKYAAIALQALHGAAFIPRATGQDNLNALRNAADELTNRYSFSLLAADNDPTAAAGLGLRLVDRNVKEGERFIYRVFLSRIDSTYSIDTAYAVIDVKKYEVPPAPPRLTSEGLDGSIVLRWEEILGGGYSGYYVYRSDDGGKSYKRLNEIPFVNVTPDQAKSKGIPRFLDTTIVNYRIYRYAVRGVTPFGELSAAAEINAWGRDLTPPGAPQVDMPKQVSLKGIRITWSIKDPDPDLAGFVIARSENSISGYSELVKKPLPKSTREFVDTTFTTDQAYYIVGAVDTAGNVSPSLPVYTYVIDSIPPAIPKGLRGRIDTLGIVRLSWNLGPESDIVGYRVLRANDPTHEFSQLTGMPWKDTTYVDTVNLKTLTRYVYYRVSAVDKRFNHSDVSPMLVIKRPDRIAPEPPVFLNLFVTDSTVQLLWAPSTSEDVRSQVLQRRKQGEREWRTIATLKSADSRYVDRNVQQNIMFDYRIEAVDSTGYRSGFAMPVQARPYDSGQRPGVDSLRASYDQKAGLITIRWSFKANLKENYWFIVYRATDGYQLAQYRSVDSKTRMFEDKGLTGKGIYRYAVKVMTAIGESKLSAAVQIRISQ